MVPITLEGFEHTDSSSRPSAELKGSGAGDPAASLLSVQSRAGADPLPVKGHRVNASSLYGLCSVVAAVQLGCGRGAVRGNAEMNKGD